MRSHTTTVWQMAEDGFVLVRDDSVPYSGPVAHAKGATAEEKNTAADTTNFYKSLQGDYEQMFAGQTSILNTLKTGMSQIFNQGINQYGFSPAEDAALRTQSTEGTAAAAKMAKQATGENLASVGGGTEFLPSGAKDQMTSEINSRAALQDATQQLGITQAGYEQGRQNFLASASALGGTASEYNPTGYAGLTQSGMNSAFGMDKTIQEQDTAAGPWAIAGGLLGGAAGSFLNSYTGGLGSKLAKGTKTAPASNTYNPLSSSQG